MALSVKTERITSSDYYEYGNMSITGIPTQPDSINLFLINKENGQKTIRIITLNPIAWQKQESEGDGAFMAGCRALHHTRLNKHTMDFSTRLANVTRGTCAIFLPFVNTFRNMGNAKKHCNADKILEAMGNKMNVAGVAIKGVVVKEFPKDALDVLTDDIAKLTDARRLHLLYELVSASLKTIGKELQLAKAPLYPAQDIICDAIETVEGAVHANKRDLEEIRKRLERIEKRKETLTPKETVELRRIHLKIADIITDRVKFFKEKAQKEKRKAA